MRYLNVSFLRPALFGIFAWAAANVQPLTGQTELSFLAPEKAQAQFGLEGWFRPRWTHPGLIGVDRNDSTEPIIYVIRREGYREDIAFRLEGALIRVRGLAGGANGAIALIGTATSAESRFAPFVAWISPDRKEQTVTRLLPYYPQVVAVASDGRIWTAGFVNVDNTIVEHQIMRRFDSSGRVLSAFLPGTTVAVQPHPTGSSYLFGSKDRMGWYFPRGNGYMEFSLDGQLLMRVRGVGGPGRAKDITGAALSNGGEVLVGMRDPQARKNTIFRLNRNNRSWTPIAFANDALPYGTLLLGFDGDDLVTSDKSGTIGFHRPSRSGQSQ
jgi:hypothetical protein